MAISVRHLISATLAICLYAAPFLLRAQPSAPPSNPLKVRFFYIGYDYSARAMSYPELQAKFGEAKNAATLRLAPNALSPPYDYSGPLPIILYREVRQDDHLVRQTLAELTCPPMWKGVIFLVTPADQSAPFPFNFTPVEYWGDDIPDNTLRILNMCPVSLGIKAADTSNVIASCGSADFPISPDADALPLIVARRQGDDWQAVISTTRPKPEAAHTAPSAVQPKPEAGHLLISTIRPKPEASRTLMIAFPDAPEFNTVRLLQLDNPPQSPPPPAAAR